MRFFGFMSDIDYCVRARRAGYQLLIAPGAWLHHVGSGHAKEAAKDDATRMQILNKNVADADRAWAQFRAKWGDGLPADYRDLGAEALNRIVARGAVDGSSDYHAPPALDPNVCEIH